MAPRDLYRDEEALSSFLDGLINAGSQSPNTSTDPNHSPHPNNTTCFDKTQLGSAISFANQLLLESRQCAPLPKLTDSHENIADVLAASLSSIVHLTKCFKANAKLRVEAERATQDSNTHVQRLSQSLQTTKEKLEKKDSALFQSKAALADLDAKTRRKIRQLTMENVELKKQVTTASHRENQLHLDAKRREKQITQLQTRVHSLISYGKRVNIDVDITPGERSRVQMDHERLRKQKQGAMDGGDTDDGVDDCGVAPRVLEENRRFRELMREVHMELDDMIVQYPKAFSFLYPEKGEDNGEASDESDSEENSNKVPAIAVSEERMNLPYELIQEEVENSLDEKLGALRQVLSNIE